MLRSEAAASVICLPRMPLTAPEPQNTDTNGIHATWAGHDITFVILTKNTSKLQHIRLPSLCAYPQYKYAYAHNYSAHGQELSGCVRADAYNLI